MENKMTRLATVFLISLAFYASAIEEIVFDPAKKAPAFLLSRKTALNQNYEYGRHADGKAVINVSADSSKSNRVRLSPLSPFSITDCDEFLVKIPICLPDNTSVQSMRISLMEPGHETFFFTQPVMQKPGWQEIVFRIDAAKEYANSIKIHYPKQVKHTNDGKMNFPLVLGFSVQFKSGTGKQTFQIGAIRVDYVKNTRPLRPRLYTGTPVNVLDVRTKNVPEIQIRNINGKPVRGLFRYTVSDAWGKAEQKGELPVSIESGKTQVLKLSRPEKFGVYLIDSVYTESDGKKLEQKQRFAYMLPSGPKKEHGNGFRFGIHSHPQYQVPYIENEALAMALCGGEILRTGFLWKLYEPVKGDCDFSLLDAALDTYGAQGIKWQAGLSATNIPKWAVAKEWKPLHPNRAMCGYPDREAFSALMKKVLERYKKQIAYMEIFNEPDLSSFSNMSAETYAKFLREAYSILKQLNPKLKVLSGGFACPPGTNHPSMNEPDFMKKTLEKAGRSFDILAYHQHGHFAGFPKGTQAVLALRNQYCPGVPIYPNETGITSTLCSEIVQGETLFTKLIYSWAQGAVGYTWYNLRNDGFDPDYTEANYGMMTKDFQPKPVYGVYNMLSGLFHNAKFIRDVQLGNRSFCYLFRQPSGDWLVPCWGMDSDLAALANSKAYSEIDLFGNETILPGKQPFSVLSVKRTPRIYRFKNAKEPVISRLLASSAPIFIGNRNGAAEFSVENASGRALELRLTASSDPPVYRISQPGKNIPLQPGEKKKIVWNFEKNGTEKDTARLTLKIAVGNGHPTTVSFPVSEIKNLPRNEFGKPHFLIRDSSQWTQLVPSEAGTVKQIWTGPGDMSARVYLAQMKGSLMVKVDVFDDKHVQPFHGESIWKGDSVQLLFQVPGQSGFFELGMALSDKGEKMKYCWSVPEGFSAKKILDQWTVLGIRHLNKSLTCYYTSFPLSIMGIDPLKSTTVRFNVLLNDNDGYGRESQLGIVPGKDPLSFPLIMLKPEPKAKSLKQ